MIGAAERGYTAGYEGRDPRLPRADAERLAYLRGYEHGQQAARNDEFRVRGLLYPSHRAA